MRALAIARFRLWTTVRAATPIVLLAAVAPAIALIVGLVVARRSEFSPDMAMRVCATAAILSWSFHGFILFGSAHEFGRVHSLTDTLHPSDLIDSAPLPPEEKATGELLGVLAATLLIHLSCLPILAMVAALSPLPNIFFVWFEAIILAIVALASASAAWRRVAVKATQNVRAVRNILLLVLLLMVAVIATTRPIAFRDAAFQFFIGPSVAAWGRVLATIEHPWAMVALFAAIYAGYIAFYFVSSGRTAQE